MIERYNERAEFIQELLKKWRVIEIDRLGHSPSTTIPFVWEIEVFQPFTHPCGS